MIVLSTSKRAYWRQGHGYCPLLASCPKVITSPLSSGFAGQLNSSGKKTNKKKLNSNLIEKSSKVCLIDLLQFTWGSVAQGQSCSNCECKWVQRGGQLWLKRMSWTLQRGLLIEQSLSSGRIIDPPRFWLISGLGGENSANYGHCCSESNRHADS